MPCQDIFYTKFNNNDVILLMLCVFFFIDFVKIIDWFFAKTVETFRVRT